MKDVRLLLHLLDVIDVEDIKTPKNNEIITILLNLRKRLFSPKFYLDHELISDSNIELTYQKNYNLCKSKYSFKEYKKSFELATNYIYAGNYFGIDLLKLMLASIYCLGAFDIAAAMYGRCYDLINDIDSCFFCGLSLWYLGDKDTAREKLIHFMSIVNESAANKAKYKEFYGIANKLTTI